MKLFFKFFIILLIAQQSEARDIFLITYKNHGPGLEMLQRAFKNEVDLPENLITIKKVDFPCRPIYGTVMHYCIDEHDDIKVVTAKTEILKRSFSQFLRKK